MSEKLSSYVGLQKELLVLEREAEKEEASLATEGAKLSALQSSGQAILRLSLKSESSDAGGRQQICLSTSGGREISAARISSGDIVGVRRHGKSDGAGAAGIVEGVVVKMEETTISISLDDVLPEVEDHSALFLVLKLTSNVTHKRFTAGLENLEKAYSDPTHVSNALLRVLLGERTPRFTEEKSSLDDTALAELNKEQQRAVQCALDAKDLAVIHGPPGTGKTHTLVAYILAEVARGNRVLVSAPSNVAVDNIAERLPRSDRKIKFVRAGHPARIMPSVIEHSLDALLARTDEAALARDIRKELEELQASVVKTKHRGERKSLRLQQRELRKDLRKRERLAVQRLLARVDVVLSTISGAGARVLDIAEGLKPFDVVVVDEAAQALEAACWVPLLRAKKAVLAGDPYQLAGTVKCAEAEARGLKTSILDRVFSTPELQSAVVMLRTQYRMNSVISTWSSGEFYSGNLVADSSVANHRVVEINGCNVEADDDENLVNPFILIDTAGGDCEEDDLSKEISEDPSNKGEAAIVSQVVAQFVLNGVPKKDIAVISPYSGQVELLRRVLWPEHGRSIEVATIDSFQGREKEVVCMSLVRSNERGDVGFLKDDRRLNVAITRARRCILIVCDSETISTHPLLERVVQYSENHGHYRSAVVDFPDIVGTYSQQRRPKEAIDAEGRPQAVKKGTKRVKGPKKIIKAKSKSIPKPAPAELKGWSRTTTDSERDDLQSRLRQEIESFAKNDSLVEKTYPRTLSSIGRLFVHELSEEFNLNHKSEDVEGSRQIKVWKKDSRSQRRGDQSKVVEEDGEGESRHDPGPTQGGMFELLGNESEDEHAQEGVRSDDAHAPQTSEYEDINSLLRRVALAKESRDMEAAPGPAAQPSGSASGAAVWCQSG
ncbi:unnamed protein product [Chondrus crispus]|uniref:DNA helicase n=1 Tax=Chondrus crispus TaxID=2769 RepID=R7QTS1_CHOCR|nr:unnamed protein product [Chondrus crispus]CDF41103.1 unnamed protein product [Chondrus crispus]|eukprot:XP_005711397.1 unnamed protein product [Chondrus crispus]